MRAIRATSAGLSLAVTGRIMEALRPYKRVGEATTAGATVSDC